MGEWVLAAAIGFASGVLSGALGIGGGIVTTPAIRLFMGAPALIAVGTPLPVIIPSAVTGALSYARRDITDVRSGIVLGAAGATTAVAGAVLATRAGGTVVLLGTSALILYAAADTILQVIRPPREQAPESPAEEAPQARPRTGPLLVIGAIAGLYSGFFGLGGGFVLVPLLTRWLVFPIKRAIGTSLVAVAILAVPGTVTHALLGNIDWGIALSLMIGVIPGAMIGARITLGARDRSVRIAFAVLLVIVGAWLATSEIAAVLR